ncbi:MAG TPA: hypothetical protein VGX49_13980 [Jatrophihabitans sp.]|jgi:hypothetical protein|nr:hypothetical protein [Jatrophihabitans sp.]
MTSAQDRPRRRRRRARQSAAEPGGQPGATADGQGARTGSEPKPAERRSGDPGTGRRDDPGRGHGRDSERGWRELAGSSPSQVGLGGAMRARDVARPTPAELAAAERSVVLIRRQWQPPET